jgi:hypothetical protein
VASNATSSITVSTTPRITSRLPKPTSSMPKEL